MDHGSLADRVLVTQEVAPASASSGAKNGAGVDMAGWDGVLFAISVGAITGAGVIDGRAESDDNSGFNSATNVSGVNATGANVNAALTQVVNANTTQLIDVYKPSERYVRCVVTPAANTVAYAVTAIRYRAGGLLPPTQSAEQTIRVRCN